MAAPFLLAGLTGARIAGVVGSAMRSAGGVLVSTAAHTLLTPATRSITYGLNSQWKNVAPEAGELFNLWWNQGAASGSPKEITRTDLEQMASYLGIALTAPATNAARQLDAKFWNAILDLSQPTFDQTWWNALFHARGPVTDESRGEWHAGMRRLGYNENVKRLLAWKMHGWPTLEEVLTQHFIAPRDTAGFAEQVALTGITHPAVVDWRMKQTQPLSPELVIQLWIAGLIDADKRNWLLRAAGLREDSIREMALTQKWSTLLGGPGEWFVRDRLYSEQKTAEFNSARKASGHDNPFVYDMLRFTDSILDLQVAIEMRRRGKISEATFQKHLICGGFKSGELENAAFDLLDQLPAASDLVMFGVRDIFDPVIAQTHGLYTEFPEAIRPLAAMLGMADKRFDVTIGSASTKQSLIELHWAAHWQPISPSQAYEMLHRIRPDNISQWQRIFPGIAPFTITDVHRWLKVADYQPNIRESLAAISYRPMRLVDVRRGFTTGIMPRAEAVARYQDLGYTLADAERGIDLLEGIKRQQDTVKFRQMLANLRSKSIRDIVQGYANGFLENVAAIDALVSHGATVSEAEEALALAEAAALAEDTRQAFRAVRRAFLAGTINIVEATGRLRQMGVTEEKVATHLARWSTMLTAHRRAETVAQIEKWVEEGLVSPDDARERMHNLGIADPDARLYLREARLREDMLRAKAIRADEHAAARRAKELQKVAAENERHREHLAREIRRATPVPMILRWLRRGEVSPEFAEERLAAMLMEPKEIARLMEGLENGQTGKTPTAEQHAAGSARET